MSPEVLLQFAEKLRAQGIDEAVIDRLMAQASNYDDGAAVQAPGVPSPGGGFLNSSKPPKPSGPDPGTMSGDEFMSHMDQRTERAGKNLTDLASNWFGSEAEIPETEGNVPPVDASLVTPPGAAPTGGVSPIPGTGGMPFKPAFAKTVKDTVANATDPYDETSLDPKVREKWARDFQINPVRGTLLEAENQGPGKRGWGGTAGTLLEAEEPGAVDPPGFLDRARSALGGLSLNTPAGQGLLAASLGILGSQSYGNTGAAIGKGGMAGLGAFMKAKELETETGLKKETLDVEREKARYTRGEKATDNARQLMNVLLKMSETPEGAKNARDIYSGNRTLQHEFPGDPTTMFSGSGKSRGPLANVYQRVVDVGIGGLKPGERDLMNYTRPYDPAMGYAHQDVSKNPLSPVMSAEERAAEFRKQYGAYGGPGLGRPEMNRAKVAEEKKAQADVAMWKKELEGRGLTEKQVLDEIDKRLAAKYLGGHQ